MAVRARSRVEASLSKGLGGLRRVSRQVRTNTALSRLPFVGQRIGRSTRAELEGLSPEAAQHAKRNFRFGVVNGIMFTLVDTLISPTLVLALFVSKLGGPNVLVGLLPAIVNGGWFLPQILVAGRVQGLPRVMHWYSRVGLIRIASMAFLALSTLLFTGIPWLLLTLFFFFYTLYSFGGGFTGIPWLEMVGKVVAPRRRGTFFGLRNFWGGLAGLLAAGPVGAVLSEQLLGLSFPHNFALLFTVTTIVVAIGVWCWSSIREPAATTVSESISVRTLVSRGRRAFRQDYDYRAFMLIRVLLAMVTIADPFYVVFATEKLGAPPELVGLYLGSLAISSLLSNFLWSPLSDRASNRTLMLATSGSALSVPLSAVAIALLAGMISSPVPGFLFSVVFILSGLALGGARIVNNNMLLTIAPPAERATYIGFLNTVLGFAIFVPVLGGMIVDIIGFITVFVIALVLAAGGVLLSTRMGRKP